MAAISDTHGALADGCKQAPGDYAPVINRNRCEGKADCVAVCPKQVFAIAVLSELERSALSFRGKIKGVVHGWKQAHTPNLAACEACGLCVQSCPEKAITLKRVIAQAAEPAANAVPRRLR